LNIGKPQRNLGSMIRPASVLTWRANSRRVRQALDEAAGRT
jgi:hypothetical protein